MDKEALQTIGRPHRTCANCDAALVQIERHASALRPAGRAKLERLDYCPDCWTAIKDEIYDSFWITRREVKAPRIRLNRRQRSVALRALFESLWDRREDDGSTSEEAPELASARLYVLAHLLLKWGGLRWRENRIDEDGRERVIFEDPASGTAIEIPGIELDDERTATVMQEIEDFLRHYHPGDDGEL